jgi:hypothetical protein
MSDDVVEFYDKGLASLIRALGALTLPKARVGVLGGKTTRTQQGSAETNASIGAKHEFGEENMPIRSFLRMPITNELQKFLENSKAFTPEVLQEVIRSGSIEAWLKKVGVVAEAVVMEAFNTGGFGHWKPSNMANKKNHQTLVETKQLRDSITSEVK